LQQGRIGRGFLLLNAALVFRAQVPPVREARAWLPFLQVVLAALARPEGETLPPTLLLWGKIAEQIRKLPVAAGLPQLAAEHPYNLSFINNETMLDLFRPMRLLRAEKELPCRNQGLSDNSFQI
jgi:uracil-DNA glycosylase